MFSPKTASYSLFFLLAATGFWLGDALLDAYVFQKGNVGALIFTGLTAHEIYSRLLVIALLAILVAGLHRQSLCHVRALAESAEKERMLRAITGAAPDAVVLMDSRGRVAFWNAAATRMFGYPAAEVMGRDVHAMLALDESHPLYRRGLEAFRETGDGTVVDHTSEFTAVRRDGTHFPVEISVSSLQLGGEWHALAIVRDIRERKAALTQLEESYRASARAEQEWMDIFNAVRDPMFIHDGEGRLLKANQAYLELVDGEAMLGRPYWEVFPRSSGPLPNCHHAMEGHRDHGTDELISGSGRTFISRAFSSRDTDGAFRWGVHILEDITEQRVAEQVLREREARLAAILEAARNVAFIVTDLQGEDARILEFSPGAEAIFGYRREEMFGQPVAMLHSPEEAGRFPDVVAAMRERREGFSGEIELLRRGGERFPALFSSYPIFDCDGNMIAALGVSVDISDRKRAEAALRLSEQRLSEAQRIAHLGHWHWDIRTDTLDWSDEVYRIFGLTPHSFGATYEAFLERVHADDRMRVQAMVDRALVTGQYDVEHRVMRADGKERVVYEQARISRDARGKPVEMFGTVLDITQRKQAQERLEWARRLYAVLSEVNKAIVRLDDRAALLAEICRIVVEQGQFRMAWIGEFQEASHCVVPLLSCGHVEGYLDHFCIDIDDRAQGGGPTGQSLKRGTHVVCNDIANDPGMGPWRDAALARDYRANAAFPFKEEGRTAGVLTVYAEQPLFFTDDIVRLFLGLADDISYALTALANRDQRSRAERQLRQAHQKLSLHMQKTPLGVIEIDREGRVVQWNRAAERIFGYRRADVVEQPASFLCVPPASCLAQVFAEMLREGENISLSLENLAAGQRLITCEWYNTAVVDSDGRVTGVMSLVNDITELVASRRQIQALNVGLEQRVRERTAELIAVNKELESFSYSVSHDLRAPLRSIDGFSRLLLTRYHGQLDATGRDYLERVRNASQRMGMLIDDLLRLSRVTRAELLREWVDFSMLVHKVAAELRQTEPARQVEWLIQDGVVVHGDAQLLRIALENLLGNAWKFTSLRQGARIEFGVLEQGGECVYFVRDNGAGFDRRYADKLFGPFQRLHATEEFPGTGIGLATVQRIAHRHGGRVWGEGEVGKGAVFHFTLAPQELEVTKKNHAENQTPAVG